MRGAPAPRLFRSGALLGAASLVESVECAGTDNAAEVRKLDIALEDAEACGSQEELVSRVKSLAQRLHAEIDLGNGIAEPSIAAAVEKETGEPTDLNVYTVFDGTVFDESIPGDKLKYLNFRHEKLTAAIEAGTSSGAFAELLQKAVEMEATLAVERSAEEEAEATRLEEEEKARLKAEKKKKKKKKK